MSETFNERLLKYKEEKFIEFVEQASELYEVDHIPKVLFIDGFIPNKPYASANIDIVNKTIRVSREHLKEMTIDKIKEKAFHEVIHLFEPSNIGKNDQCIKV